MKKTKVIALLLALTMTMSLVACKNKDASKETGTNTEASVDETDKGDTPEGTSSEPVEISYATFMVGSHASAAAEEEVINAFNKKFEGKYKVVVEELPSDNAFVDKMKILASSQTLPDVLIGKNGIRELAIENGQAVNIKPFLEADPEWMKFVGEDAMNYNMEDDGSVYSISNQRQIIGYFYNKDMFSKAGVTPAKTWDEFMSNNAKLKKAGFTPLALMTGENAWTTNLWLAAMIGTDGADGNAFMNTSYPANYNNSSVIKGLEMLKTCLKEYTTPDAVGALYANAANNFEQGNVAMIANGPWMCPDFTDETKSIPGFGDQVGVALYPEDGLIAQFEVGYILCTNGKSAEEQAGALEFLKFKTSEYAQSVFLEKAGVLPLTDNIEMSAEYKAANPILSELIQLSGSAKYTFENIDNTAFSSIVDETAVRYPELAYDEITPEEFADYLTKAAEMSK
ncbi:carbohydrate ABC transporter substrate-binding protein (CUT1 family) [Mobilisporobacter senegalensis]|uniref:Carbohydrate ABC transporter substrate-binding protein (CUT1 family) n=1 Tax=Mobilisporobacter senegalensis TaxID=1329262 RepID=A0A3N1XST6_9FIRM|nr:extracellular solute-binding protein [Mobilisporobacter senegalensis]ROR28232.1 carbohydrate ABC transporter substrate-binding protein (CUT1 family) [Mobilisporobacter senegalensis]